MLLTTHSDHGRGRRVREFVCSYRTLRDDEGQAAPARRAVARSPDRRRCRLLLQLPRGRHRRPTAARRRSRMTRRWAITRRDFRASLGPVKPLRFAPTPSGLPGLTGPPGRLAWAIA